MRRTGFALVELLVVVVIIAILAGAFMAFHGHGKAKKTTPTQAINKAKSVECMSNLNQIRESIQMDIASDGHPPARIDQGVTASIDRCPVSGKPYSYDPRTGRVWCTTPGHERY